MVFQKYFKGVSSMIQASFKQVSNKFQVSFTKFSWKFQWVFQCSCKGVSKKLRNFPGCFEHLSRKFLKAV